MSGFKFRSLQRVIVPAAAASAPNVQGIIIGGGAILDGIPQYDVQFFSHLKRDANGRAEGCIVSVPEPELIAAQPPIMMPAGEAIEAEKAAYTRGRDSMRRDIEAEREARARKRKKPAKAKSKSKRKH